MGALNTALRNLLGRTVLTARRVGEEDADKALKSLAVHHHEPWGSMSAEDRALRNRLRAHGRQLGDKRNMRSGTQAIGRLAHEVAYEHWHRMLFARFLAENGLLIEPEHGVPVSLDDCRELAREGNTDWLTLASNYAVRMLPQIFRADDPVLEVVLSPETRQELERLLESMPTEVFLADDSLGWTYQYWQADKKDEVNASGVKIGADELPAVTQLFTEHYMVLFLYHNTIGAWHAGKVLAENPSLAETAESEEELRQAVRLRSQGGYDFDYLRFVREPQEGDEEDTPTGSWCPAAGTYEGWPKTAKELKVLDPCCGSGHFLVEGFELLVRLRTHEEGMNLEDAIRRVLTDNLHGLELDLRCTQIAAFNLAMAAWKLAGKPIELPPLHIACSGLAVGSSKKEWTKLAGENERLRAGMAQLHDLFEQAPELGSLIDPKALKGDLLIADFAELQPLLAQTLARESEDVEDTERTVAAQGMARAAELLSGEYTLVITNVPYLGRGQQSDLLKDFADEHYKEAKADLATLFVERMLRWLGGTGTAAAVTPQNWLFLTSYRKLREKLLKRRTWNLVARLGSGAFETIGGEVVNVALVAISGSKPREVAEMAGVDAMHGSTPAHKATLLRGQPVAGPETGQSDGTVQVLSQAQQLGNPDAVVLTSTLTRGELLGEYATVTEGLSTGDSDRYVRGFWEIRLVGTPWVWFQGPPPYTTRHRGRESVLLWEDGNGELAHSDRARIQGHSAWGQDGVIVGQMSQLKCSIYTGEIHDKITGAIVPLNPTNLPAIWAFCEADNYNSAIRQINTKLNVATATLVKVPFDLAHWQGVAGEKYPNGLPEPQSDDPTQWLFHSHPAKAEPATLLQVAVGRLLGYRWPPELDPEMRLAKEARDWVARCDELKEYADEDGIVCLSAARGERSAADRVRELLSAAFGPDWSAAKERELLAVAGDGNRPADSLDTWLRDKFFEEHCKLFQHRPFVWHIWDGNGKGFHCLVNTHKLTGPDGEGHRTLQAITYTYLGDWIDRQRAEQQKGTEGSDARLAAALDLKEQLEKILAGEPPYDIFVRWKPLHEQPMGWEPDINDGVRINIRPFMSGTLRKGGKKGAGILRWKPNIKWKKDRGKEPQSLRPKEDFPWFWDWDEKTENFKGGPEFDGNRWNDMHYTSAVKEAARKRHAELNR